jgi:hypothetical protein
LLSHASAFGGAATFPGKLKSAATVAGVAKIMVREESDNSERKGASLSWTAMLMIVLLAILAAAGCAYLVVYPFFHRRAP